MGQKEKLIQRIKTIPRNFTFDEGATLLGLLDFELSNKGKTSGSRVKFYHPSGVTIIMHKPHPRKELLPYQVKEIVDILEREGLI